MSFAGIPRCPPPDRVGVSGPGLDTCDRVPTDRAAAAPATPATTRATTAATAPPRAPAILLGLGLGGFVDGIVLHQILQWHHMLTSTGDHPMTTVAGLETNTLVDGFFHVATWLLVAAGTTLAVRAWQQGRLAPPWRLHVGLMLAGWGAFNLVEGLIDHQLLGIHHVRDDLGGPLGWDLAFLASGVLLLAVGLALARSAQPPSADRRRAPAAQAPPA